MPLIGKSLEGWTPALAPSGLALLTTLSMVSALVLMIPVAWIYTLSKRSTGCASSPASETLTETQPSDPRADNRCDGGPEGRESLPEG